MKTTTTTDRIHTRHPDGKQGVNIERAKYAAMKHAILAVTPPEAPGVAFGSLARKVREHLSNAIFPPEASLSWYVTTVKLDLEARGLVGRVPGVRPQRIVRRG